MEKPSVWWLGCLMATSSIGERILCALLLPRGSGASDRDRDLGGATLLSSPTTTTSTTITNIGASVTKQNHQPLTVHVNQRWQLLITTPEVDEQSHKLWVLPSLWKRDWVCALLAPSTLSWVRLHCARQSAVHCALCAPDVERHQERREAAVEERKGLAGKARRRSQLCRKSNSPAQLCKKRFVEESHPVIRPLSVSFLFRTSGKEYHSQADSASTIPPHVLNVLLFLSENLLLSENITQKLKITKTQYAFTLKVIYMTIKF